MKILIVDDSVIARKKLKTIFQNNDIDVVGVAKDGREAVEKYKELHPDIVTMDITMPDMNGIDATKQIIAYDEEAIIMMITSHGQEQMVIDAIQAGAKSYVTKPFESSNVIKNIKLVYERYGSYDEKI